MPISSPTQSTVWLTLRFAVAVLMSGMTPYAASFWGITSCIGVLVIHPPHTLKATLASALKQVADMLGQSKYTAFDIETGS